MRRFVTAIILVLAITFMFATTAMAKAATTPVKSNQGLTTGEGSHTVIALKVCGPYRICENRTKCRHYRKWEKRCTKVKHCFKRLYCRDCHIGRKCRTAIRCRKRKINNRWKFRCQKEQKCRPKRYCGGRWRRCKTINICNYRNKCRRVRGPRQKHCRTVRRCYVKMRCINR